MSLLRARGLAITASEFAQCLAPFQRHRTTTLASSDAVPSRSPRDMAIAVSGGVDSMALATLLARHYSSPGSTTRLHALIVDHRLRDNSTAEAAFVAQQVQLLGTESIIPLSSEQQEKRRFLATPLDIVSQHTSDRGPFSLLFLS